MIEQPDFSRARLTMADLIRVGDADVRVDHIISRLSTHLTDERRARLDDVVSKRSFHVTTVLENIYDRGNVSAVMRSAEAFGFLRLFLVDAPGARFKAANRITKGAEKWLDVKPHGSAAAAVADLRRRGYAIWATDLDTTDTIDSINWSRPTAVVLGNEKSGVSDEMRGLVDGRFRVPMAGFSQSFNISVAAALIFYRAHLETRDLDEAVRLSGTERRQVLANYLLRCFDNPAGILAAHARGVAVSE